LNSVLVLGGYGVFGSIVARELAELGIRVTIAGRDPVKAKAFAQTLGPKHKGLAADASDPVSCKAASKEQRVVVNCAGPFSSLGPTVLDACLEANCHYTDIADDRGYTSLVRSYGDRFRERGLTAVFGCSSLPGISGALAVMTRSGVSRAPARACVTLFVGNDNPKGSAAVRSVVECVGKRIQTSQGVVVGFTDKERALFPPPFGQRPVFNFESPEYDLFPDLLGVRSVSVKIGLEMRSGAGTLALLAKLPLRYGRRTTRILEWMGQRVRGLGTPGGSVMVELFWLDGSTKSAAIASVNDGQRMAALPCVWAAQALLGDCPPPGALPAYEFLGATALVGKLAAQCCLLRQS
jgi:NAD(P)-dependent dehydrogenase (short-subunit alcohol dehydrogenase family)